jgi:uncharacterized protein (DUF952 family)
MLIYKITDAASWQSALEAGHFDGSPDDVRDGFIHLSTAAQTPVTLAKHFARRDDLIIAAVDAASLGATLKWEVSRGGEKFPHIYGPLPIASVRWWKPLRLGDDGLHALPDDVVG